MVKIFNTYKLNDGITHEQCRQWSRDANQPIVSRQPGVLKYEVYEIECDIVEVVEAESWEAWEAMNDQPEVKVEASSFYGSSTTARYKRFMDRRSRPNQKSTRPCDARSARRGRRRRCVVLASCEGDTLRLRVATSVRGGRSIGVPMPGRMCEQIRWRSRW
jgi:hypothetical protein